MDDLFDTYTKQILLIKRASAESMEKYFNEIDDIVRQLESNFNS